MTEEPKKNPEELNEQYDYISYIIGAMTITAEQDGGIAKREDLCKELLLRNVLPINPAKLEQAKTGMDVGDAVDKIKGWIASGQRDKIQETGRRIWKGYTYEDTEGNLIHSCGDLDYTKESSFITFVLHEKDKPCGTFFECGVAIEHDIPIYLITKIPKKDLPQSLILGIESVDGEFFETLPQYLEFIDKKYKLHRIEEKK